MEIRDGEYLCMCEEIGAVARDGKSTCMNCGGIDAYGAASRLDAIDSSKMSAKAKEHYKNNPNDLPHTNREKRLMSKYDKLKRRLKALDIMRRGRIWLLRQQVRADSHIKEMMLEMYPEEGKRVLDAVFAKYGRMKRQEERIKDFVKEQRIKPDNIPKGW